MILFDLLLLRGKSALLFQKPVRCAYLSHIMEQCRIVDLFAFLFALPAQLCYLYGIMRHSAGMPSC